MFRFVHSWRPHVSFCRAYEKLP